MDGGRLRERGAAISAAAVIIGSALAVGLAAPAAADLPTSGLWIFPHERQAAVLGGGLGQYYYNTSSDNEWIADAFFADADADGASVAVDFYNPSGSDMTNVILWVAVSSGEVFEGLEFSGGSSGDFSVVLDDLGGGTPTTGASLPDYVYPAFYTSYGIGDVPAGSSGIVTVNIDVTGDFAGDLVIRLDYTATDANGDDASGPFEAGMTIYEWGDLPADNGDDPTCPDDADLSLSGSTSGMMRDGVFLVTVALALEATEGYSAGPVIVELHWDLAFDESSLPGGHSAGVTTLEIDEVGADAGRFAADNLTAVVQPLLLPGDTVTVILRVVWDGCDGGGEASLRLNTTVDRDPTGRVKSANSWANEVFDAMKDEKRKKPRAEYNTSQFDTFVRAIALHSDVFAYGAWNGTDPFGDEDAGWVDIEDLDDVMDILDKRGRGDRSAKEAQQELLALWLNIASGRANLDSELKVWKKHFSWGADRYEDGEVPGDVQRIVGFAEQSLLDWANTDDPAGGHHQKGHHWWLKHWREGNDLRLAAALCWLVNAGWLRVVS
jgi:hypothetical protein